MPVKTIKRIVVFDAEWSHEIIQSFYLSQDRKRLVPGLVLMNGDAPHFEVNSHGFKGPEVDTGKILAAVWGDSVVFGIGRGWVEGLNALFPGWHFINGGIEGDQFDNITERAFEANDRLRISWNIVFPGWHSRNDPALVRRFLGRCAEKLPGAVFMTVPIAFTPGIARQDLTGEFDLKGDADKGFYFLGSARYSVDNCRTLVREFLRQNEIVRAVARERGVPLIDLYEKFRSDDLAQSKKVFFDIGHFRPSAYGLLQKAVCEGLQGILQRKENA